VISRLRSTSIRTALIGVVFGAMETVLISSVGQQPAAVAAFLGAWCHTYGPPKRVVLLATRSTRTFADRLAESYPSANIIVHDVDVFLFEPKAPHRVVETVLAEFQEARPVLFVNPGMSFHVAALAGSLPSPCRFVEGSTDGFRFFDPGRDLGEAFPAVPIGWKTLLQLHGVRYKETGHVRAPLDGWLKNTRCADGVVRGLEVQFENETALLDLAFERGGWLHAAIGLPEPPRDKPKNDSTVATRLERGRLAVRLREGLGPFRFRTAVATDNEGAKIRARRHQVTLISSRSSLERWLIGTSGSDKPAKWPDALDDPVTGAGGDGPALATFVGTDASATIAALYAHRPAAAELFVDAHSDAVIAAAVRIAEAKRFLPCGTVQFVRTDRCGSGIASAIHDLTHANPRILANVSPGTNAQSVALARTFLSDSLWSIEQGKQPKARALFGSSETLIEPAALSVHGAIVGGTLVATGQLANDWPYLDALLAAGRHMAVGEITAADLSSRRETAAALRRVGLARLLKVWRFDRHGYLEDIVAACFVRALASEVRVNMTWAWPPPFEARIQKRQNESKHGHARSADRPFSDEGDVIVRWGQALLAVDARSGARPDPQVVRQKRKQVEALALKLGRFCVPVVCLENPTPSLLRPRATGAVVMSLATALDASRLTEFINDALERRRSTGGNPSAG